MTTRRVSRRLGQQWPWACLCLARALHHRAGLDDAVKLEAAILVDGRHEVDGGVDRLGVGHGGRVEGHGGRAHVWRECGRVVVQCGCHVGGCGSYIHGRRAGCSEVQERGCLYVCVCVRVCMYVFGTGMGERRSRGSSILRVLLGGESERDGTYRHT